MRKGAVGVPDEEENSASDSDGDAMSALALMSFDKMILPLCAQYVNGISYADMLR